MCAVCACVSGHCDAQCQLVVCSSITSVCNGVQECVPSLSACAVEFVLYVCVMESRFFPCVLFLFLFATAWPGVCLCQALENVTRETGVDFIIGLGATISNDVEAKGAQC